MGDIPRILDSKNLTSRMWALVRTECLIASKAFLMLCIYPCALYGLQGQIPDNARWRLESNIGVITSYELARSACGSCGCNYNLTKRGFSPLCIDEIRHIAASVRPPRAPGVEGSMRFSVDFNISQEWRNAKYCLSVNISYLDC